MKDLGSPAITLGLDHTPAFPMQGIGEQKTGGIGQVLVFMHDHQALGEYPATFLLPIATAYLYLPETLGVLLAQLRTHFIHAPPVTLPLDMPRDFYFTDPMLTTTLNQTRQFQRQYPIIKGIMGLRELAFSFQLTYDLHRDLRPFAVLQLMDAVVQ